MVLHDSAEDIERSVPSVIGQLSSDDRLILLDNASSDDGAAIARSIAPHAELITSPENLGFAGGVNRAAESARADLLLLLNPDAVLLPGALEELRDAAVRHPGWGAWQALVAMDDGLHVNTCGNLVHWLGFGWAGGLDQPLSAVSGDDHLVGFASGAAMVVRRADWLHVGGFDARYFMYGEDLDLCLRLRLTGREVGIVPSAVVEHGYEFTKGDYKWFHLERNRWWTLLGVYPLALLVPLALPLLVFELVLLAAAWRGGWLQAKLRAQLAVVRELPSILRRRRSIQAMRTATTTQFASGLTSSLDSPLLAQARSIPFADRLQRGFWHAVLRVVG